MEEKVEKEKNIIGMVAYYLKVNIKMEKDGMEKVMMEKIIQYMN